MKPWTYSGIKEQENEQFIDENPEGYYDYQLSGVLVHSGNADAGHYYSYIKETEGKNSGKWFEFNDTNVKNFNVN